MEDTKARLSPTPVPPLPPPVFEAEVVSEAADDEFNLSLLHENANRRPPRLLMADEDAPYALDGRLSPLQLSSSLHANGVLRNMQDLFRIGMVVVQIISLYIYYHWLSSVPSCCSETDTFNRLLILAALVGAAILFLNLLTVLNDMRDRSGERLLHYIWACVYSGVVFLILLLNRYVAVLQDSAAKLSFVVLALQASLYLYTLFAGDIRNIAINCYGGQSHSNRNCNLWFIQICRIVAILSWILNGFFIGVSLYFLIGVLRTSNDIIYYNSDKSDSWYLVNSVPYTPVTANCSLSFNYTSTSYVDGLGYVMEYCRYFKASNTPAAGDVCCEWYWGR
jgi:hypothetical protein